MKEDREGPWPTGPDGDVFRRLQSKGFDFSREYAIDFNLDFVDWPPPKELGIRVSEAFPAAEVSLDEDGFVLVKMKRKLTYEFVVDMQSKLNEIAEVFGGVCESWGVLHG